jgi:hypothetical protein
VALSTGFRANLLEYRRLFAVWRLAGERHPVHPWARRVVTSLRRCPKPRAGGVNSSRPRQGP